MRSAGVAVIRGAAASRVLKKTPTGPARAFLFLSLSIFDLFSERRLLSRLAFTIDDRTGQRDECYVSNNRRARWRVVPRSWEHVCACPSLFLYLDSIRDPDRKMPPVIPGYRRADREHPARGFLFASNRYAGTGHAWKWPFLYGREDASFQVSANSNGNV